MDGNHTDVHWLLTDLCANAGYCSAGRNPELFVDLVTEGPERFADAVLLAEGFDRLRMDNHQRRGVISFVAERFELWAEREAASRVTNTTMDQDD